MYNITTWTYRNAQINYKLPFKYNGKEQQGLGWIDYGARMYDPAVPRWLSVDPHAEKYESISPFSYGFDNPIRFVDLQGKDPGDVVVLFAGANLNPFSKDPYGVSTQLKSILQKKSNGNTVEKFFSNYAAFHNSGDVEYPVVLTQDLDELTQNAYDLIKSKPEGEGKVSIYGYSWGVVLANHLAKRLQKEGLEVSYLALVDAANGPFSEIGVNREILSNVDEFTNVFQKNWYKGAILSRGYPVTKASNRTKGKNVNVMYVKDGKSNLVKASHNTIDDATLNAFVNELIKKLNTSKSETKN